MFRILDGREEFYQWDIDRKLIVADKTIQEVHFCNKTDSCSLVCEVYNDGDVRLVDVPNVLLTTDWRINVYGYDGQATKHSATFGVRSRTKPADYVYTETEVKSYENFKERLAAVEEGLESAEKRIETVEGLENVVAGLEQKIDSKYEKLVTVKTSAEMNAISITYVGANVKLNAKTAMIRVITPNGTEDIVGYIRAVSGNTFILVATVSNLVSKASEMTTAFLAMPIYGHWFGFSLGSGKASGNAATLNNYPAVNGTYKVEDYPAITKISISAKSGKNLPAGTVVEVWGVRA